MCKTWLQQYTNILKMSYMNMKGAWCIVLLLEMKNLQNGLHELCQDLNVT